MEIARFKQQTPKYVCESYISKRESTVLKLKNKTVKYTVE